MPISDEGLVSGSVNRAELAAAYETATDEAVRANLAAVGAGNGMVVYGDRLVDASEVVAEPEPEGDGYDDLDKPSLQDLLRDRGLPTSGNKPELVDRLREDDAAAAVEETAEPAEEE